jgi:hypothetical protein
MQSIISLFSNWQIKTCSQKDNHIINTHYTQPKTIFLNVQLHTHSTKKCSQQKLQILRSVILHHTMYKNEHFYENQ